MRFASESQLDGGKDEAVPVLRTSGRNSTDAPAFWDEGSHMELYPFMLYFRGLGWLPRKPSGLQGPQAEPFLTHQMLWKLPDSQQQSLDS